MDENVDMLGEELHPSNDNFDNMVFGGDDEVEVGSEFSRGGSDEDFGIPGVNDLPLFATAEARKIDLVNKDKEAQIESYFWLKYTCLQLQQLFFLTLRLLELISSLA